MSPIDGAITRLLIGRPGKADTNVPLAGTMDQARTSSLPFHAAWTVQGVGGAVDVADRSLLASHRSSMTCSPPRSKPYLCPGAKLVHNVLTARRIRCIMRRLSTKLSSSTCHYSLMILLLIFLVLQFVFQTVIHKSAFGVGEQEDVVLFLHVLPSAPTILFTTLKLEPNLIRCNLNRAYDHN